MPTIDDYIRDLPSPEHPIAVGITCSICYERFTDPVQLPCEGDHVFCRSCIQEWLESADTCPLDREVLIEYNDDDGDLDTQDSLEVAETSASSDHLARFQNEHITPIALKIAYCRGVHSVAEPNDLSDRLHAALNDLRNKIEPSSFHTMLIMAHISKLVVADAAVDVALGIVYEAPSSHQGYQLIGEGLSDVKIKIAIASEAARNALEREE